MDKQTGNNSDHELRINVEELNSLGTSKLKIVKWVWDNSNKNLRQSKEFVDKYM